MVPSPSRTLVVEAPSSTQNATPDRISGARADRPRLNGITGAVGLALTPDRSVSRRVAGSKRRSVDVGVGPVPDDEQPSSMWRAHGGQHPHCRRLESPPPSRRSGAATDRMICARRRLATRAPTGLRAPSWRTRRGGEPRGPIGRSGRVPSSSLRCARLRADRSTGEHRTRLRSPRVRTLGWSRAVPQAGGAGTSWRRGRRARRPRGRSSPARTPASGRR